MDKRLNTEQVIGIGGIGTGQVYSFLSNETLGRNESRKATLEPNRDYCKLHIVMHYIAKLSGERLHTLPVGMVGDDPDGHELVRDMALDGIDTFHVSFSEKSTMSAVCFTYPDGDGGNITAFNSACEDVSEKYVDLRMQTIDVRPEIVFVVPEVPAPARIRMLEIAKDRGSFIAASFTSDEIGEFEDYFGDIDLLALNIDEAAAFACVGNGMAIDGFRDKEADDTKEINTSGVMEKNADDEVCNDIEDTDCTEAENLKQIVRRCFGILREKNPEAKLIVTAGARGLYACGGRVTDGGAADKGVVDSDIVFLPVLDVPVICNAGAGDAVLGGTLAALAYGLPFLPERKPFECVSSAIEIGALTAAVAVGSPDTIDFELDAEKLFDLAKVVSPAVSDQARSFLCGENFDGPFLSGEIDDIKETY